MPLLSFSQQNDSTVQLLRKYKRGESLVYRMTTNVTHNGKWQSTIIAVCELSVGFDSANIPYDEIKWLSKKVFNGKDTTDHDAEIQNTPVYRISVHPNGRLDLPTIADAGMTGEITDLNTFFVAISPRLGIDKLHKPGDNFQKPENVKGNFSNGKDILKGEDCLAVITSFTNKTWPVAIVTSDFQPPKTSCLNYFSAEMQQPVAGDTINNFQMVRSSSPNKVNLFYGRESFFIKSAVDMRDGKLLSAEMVNHLKLNLKLNCNTDYNDCQNSFPFTIQRKITIDLLQINKRTKTVPSNHTH